jgi:hypothetical protein
MNADLAQPRWENGLSITLRPFLATPALIIY